MSIPLFFNIEHYTMPQLFYYDKANFFMGTAYGKGFMHQNFNAFFNNAYKDGVIKKRRNFKAKEFTISEISYDEEHRILCVKLPNPKSSDNATHFLHSYFISFLETKDEIKVLDIYGLQQQQKMDTFGVVLSFSEDENDIRFRGIIKTDRNSIFEYMYKVAFENYYPKVDVSIWK